MTVKKLTFFKTISKLCKPLEDRVSSKTVISVIRETKWICIVVHSDGDYLPRMCGLPQNYLRSPYLQMTFSTRFSDSCRFPELEFLSINCYSEFWFALDKTLEYPRSSESVSRQIQDWGVWWGREREEGGWSDFQIPRFLFLLYSHDVNTTEVPLCLTRFLSCIPSLFPIPKYPSHPCHLRGWDVIFS